MLKSRVVGASQKFFLNPLVRLAFAAGLPPTGDALLETTGRRTGRRRLTPVCDGLDGDTFWIVSQHGRSSGYVKNLAADPRVRVRVNEGSGNAWLTGRARILDDDDARERWRIIGATNLARRACVVASAAMATNMLTIRIDDRRHRVS